MSYQTLNKLTPHPKKFPNEFKNFCIINLINPDFISLSFSCKTTKQKEKNEIPASVWSPEKAREWAKDMPWLRGSDFIPSSAINQLEMWQAETFDTTTIDRELGWAEKIGFNCMRVYLHHLAWEIDSAGFKQRINKYLSISANHNIKTIFVIFDDCWNPTYQCRKTTRSKAWYS